MTLRKAFAVAPRWVSAIYVFFGFIVSAILFRSNSMEQAWHYFQQILTFSTDGIFNSLIGWKAGYLLVLLFAELLFRNRDYPLQSLEKWLPKPLRWSLYYLLIFIIIRYAEPKEAFIYFQF